MTEQLYGMIEEGFQAGFVNNNRQLMLPFWLRQAQQDRPAGNAAGGGDAQGDKLLFQQR
jgi:hypothetical protein